ncbi:MAG: hypothetical protein HC768_13345 [Acaryochloris sp. CRU_2_0]|nr:hypothetical protein [Acaryochloris sp. CRU_2_0]
MGGDSILAIQIIAQSNQAGLKISPRLLFKHQTIADLAAIAQTDTAHLSTAHLSAAAQGPITGPVLLTPIQQRFFEHYSLTPHHFNQSVLLEVTDALDAQILQQSIDALLSHHDVLRLRFTPDEAGWQALNAPDQPGTAQDILQVVDLAPLALNEQPSALQEAIAKHRAA